MYKKKNEKNINIKLRLSEKFISHNKNNSS